jgi:hypothetical protein
VRGRRCRQRTGGGLRLTPTPLEPGGQVGGRQPPADQLSLGHVAALALDPFAASFRWQHLYKAPLLVVCLSNKHAYPDCYAEPDRGWTDRSEAHWPAPHRDIDTGLLAMLMLPTAVDAGLGALFLGVPLPRRSAGLRAAFGLPELHAIGTVAVGLGRRPRSSTGAARRLSRR